MLRARRLIEGLAARVGVLGPALGVRHVTGPL
jgi:hypothetical protein